MEMIIAFVVGILVGIVGTIIYYRAHTSGTLYINDTNPNFEPYVFLELDKDIYDIYLDKYITFKLNLKRSDSQK